MLEAYSDLEKVYLVTRNKHNENYTLPKYIASLQPLNGLVFSIPYFSFSPPLSFWQLSPLRFSCIFSLPHALSLCYLQCIFRDTPVQAHVSSFECNFYGRTLSLQRFVSIFWQVISSASYWQRNLPYSSYCSTSCTLHRALRHAVYKNYQEAKYFCIPCTFSY